MKKKVVAMIMCVSMSVVAFGCGTKNEKNNGENGAQIQNETVALADVQNGSAADSYEVAFEKSRFEISMEFLHMPTEIIEQNYGFVVDEVVTGQIYGNSPEYASAYVEAEDAYIFVNPGDKTASPLLVQFGHDSEVDFCKELFFSTELSYDELATQLSQFEFAKGEVVATEDSEYICHFTNSSMDIICISSEENGSDFYFYIGLPQ